MNVLAVSISFLALCIALFAFYWNSIRRPRYSCAPLRFVHIAHPQSSEGGALCPCICLPLVISNKGALNGVINHLYAKLRSGEDHSFAFWAHYEGEAAPSLGTDLWREHVKAFSVKAGSSVMKYIWFIAEQPSFRFRAGQYILSVFAVADSNNKPKFLVKKRLHFKNDFPVGKSNWFGSMYSSDAIVINVPDEIS